MFEDKKLVCRDCGGEFIFTAGEQEFYKERGFSKEPQRCFMCRKRRKNGMGDRNSTPVLYEVVCSKCGEIDNIPFEPRHDKPIFCGNCYREMRGTDGKK